MEHGNGCGRIAEARCAPTSGCYSAGRRWPKPVDTCCLATLLALAAHDLRQPLQLITSARDVLAALLRGKEHRRSWCRPWMPQGLLVAGTAGV